LFSVVPPNIYHASLPSNGRTRGVFPTLVVVSAYARPTLSLPAREGTCLLSRGKTMALAALPSQRADQRKVILWRRKRRLPNSSRCPLLSGRPSLSLPTREGTCFRSYRPIFTTRLSPHRGEQEGSSNLLFILSCLEFATPSPIDGSSCVCCIGNPGAAWLYGVAHFTLASRRSLSFPEDGDILSRMKTLSVSP